MSLRGNMIHAGDGDFGFAALWPEGGLRCVPGPSQGRSGNIAMADFGLSAFALFFMHSASCQSFQRALARCQGRSNCQTLFGIEKIPSDNYIRDMLDGADPALLAPCFENMERLLFEPAMREAFGRMGGRTLVALDGTEYFCSQKITCPHCQTRKRSNGKIESYQSMLAATVVAPGHSKVVPLSPEFIVKQDGAEKQDCERNAVKRWHEKHGARLKPLRPVYLADDLFACQSVVERLAETATISSSPARRPRTRRSTTSSTAAIASKPRRRAKYSRLDIAHRRRAQRCAM